MIKYTFSIEKEYVNYITSISISQKHIRLRFDQDQKWNSVALMWPATLQFEILAELSSD